MTVIIFPYSEYHFCCSCTHTKLHSKLGQQPQRTQHLSLSQGHHIPSCRPSGFHLLTLGSLRLWTCLAPFILCVADQTWPVDPCVFNDWVMLPLIILWGASGSSELCFVHAFNSETRVRWNSLNYFVFFLTLLWKYLCMRLGWCFVCTDVGERGKSSGGDSNAGGTVSY